MILPIVINMEGPAIIFGCGSVGIRKVELLSRYTKDIIVVSEDFQDMPSFVEKKIGTVTPDNISQFISKGTSLVVSALSDRELNKEIANYCFANNILVNVVDDIELCTVFFPAQSKAGELVVAISTSGKCPFLARKIREEVDDWIEEKGRWLELLAPIRCNLDTQKINEILPIIYADPVIIEMIKSGDMDGAIKKAMELTDVHCKY